MTTTKTTIAIATATVTATAAGNVTARREWEETTTPTRDDDSARIGRVFANPEGEGVGYVTSGGVDSPAWYGDREAAVRALTSRGIRGTGAGKGRPSPRWIAGLAAVSRPGGATGEQVFDAIEKATGVRPAAYLVPNLMSALRKRHGIVINLDRATGVYTVAA